MCVFGVGRLLVHAHDPVPCGRQDQRGPQRNWGRNKTAVEARDGDVTVTNLAVRLTFLLSLKQHSSHEALTDWPQLQGVTQGEHSHMVCR